jgi:hypothetical protein
MKHFFSRLTEYWERVGQVLRGESAAASIFPNSSDIGGAREKLYVDFLRAHLPAFCTVKLGGFAFGADGSESHQIDVLVASGSSLQFDFHNKDAAGKSFAAVDGLIAAASLKSYLDGAQLAEAVGNLGSLPSLTPLGNRYHPSGPPIPSYESWPLKVIYAPDGVSVETALVHLRSVTAGLPTHRWPDFVHVCGKYVITNTGVSGGRTRDGTQIPPHTFHPLAVHPDLVAFSLVVQRIQSIEQSMRFILFTYGYLLDSLPL